MPVDVHVMVYVLPTVICSPPFGEVIVKIGGAVVAVVVVVLLVAVVVVVAGTAGVAVVAGCAVCVAGIAGVAEMTPEGVVVAVEGAMVAADGEGGMTGGVVVAVSEVVVAVPVTSDDGVVIEILSCNPGARNNPGGMTPDFPAP